MALSSAGGKNRGGQPVVMGMAKVWRLHKQAAVQAMDDADALHRHGNAGEKEFYAGQAKEAAAVMACTETAAGIVAT